METGVVRSFGLTVEQFVDRFVGAVLHMVPAREPISWSV
jgi:hypothetical protein